MTWNIMLSKYSRSLFKNDLALKVIVILDRNGVSTEEDIIESIKIDKKVLNSCLYDLKLNGFIEYDDEFIKLTPVGLKLLERFDLSDLIIEDIIDSIEKRNSYKNDLKIIFKFYKSFAPYCYLHTNYSIKTWYKIINRINLNSNFIISEDELLGTCKSLIYRDIRNWISHSNLLEDDIQNKLSKEIRLLLFSNKVDIDDCISDNNNHNYAISYLLFIDDSISSSSNKLINTKLKDIYIPFHTMQCSYLPNEWFAFGESLTNIIPSSKRYTHFDNYINKLKVGLLGSTSSAILNNSNKQNKRMFETNWFAKTNTNNILANLFTSRNMNEFCLYSNFNQSEAYEIVNSIKDKCDELIVDSKSQ